MSRRDRGWRALGVLLVASGYSAGFAFRALGSGIGTTLTWLCFIATLGGLVLAVQGKRVLQVFRIEHSRHRNLPLILHLRRRR
jgi:hypothetical protein